MAFYTLVSCSTFAPDKGGMTHNETPIVYNSDFTFKASFTYAYPLNGRPIQLTAPYYIEVRNDTLYSYLPYIGRAGFLPYGGGKGLDFEAPILRFDGRENTKKGSNMYYFEVQTPEDYHSYEIEVFHSNKVVRLDVFSRQRDMIRFEGYLD